MGVKQARQIEQESGTLMHILGTGEHTLCLEQLYCCLFQTLYNSKSFMVIGLV
jgi:hypothetical protein